MLENRKILKTFVLLFMLILLNPSAHSQHPSKPSKNSDAIVLDRIGEWSPESDEFSHTKCNSNISDSLTTLIDSIKLSKCDMAIDSSVNYSFQFTKELSGRYDFMNRPIWQHECSQMEDEKVFNLESIGTDFQGSNNQNIPQIMISKGDWLIVIVRKTLWVGNSSEWVDYEYYFKKR